MFTGSEDVTVYCISAPHVHNDLALVKIVDDGVVEGFLELPLRL